MKVLLTITREQSLQIIVDVPGAETIQDAARLRSHRYSKQIVDIADERDDSDWDEWGWEATVKVTQIERDTTGDKPDGTVTL